MNLKEIRTKKREMEEGIKQNVATWVNKFTQETGFKIEGITINMIDVTSLSDAKPNYTIGHVEVELEKI